MVKKRGLGKSLDALLAFTSPETASMTEIEAISHEKLCQLPVMQVQRGKYQPRREMDPDALEDLANSIRTQGIIQPLIVRPVGDRYEIIAGERRWQAAQLVGLTEVPAIIRSIPDEAAMAIALIENIQRENLNPIEEAIAFQRLIEEFGLTHQQVADAVGKSRVTVTNLLRLLALPAPIRTLIERKQLEMGHARTLITLPEAMQTQAADVIVARNLSVRDTERLVKQMQSGKVEASIKKQLDPLTKKIQESLSRQLNLRVAIQANAKGKGKLVIHYRNSRELHELLAQLQREEVADA